MTKVDFLSDEKIVIQPASPDGVLRSGDVKMFEVLFQHILDVYFYVKDIEACWISCNASSLALLNFSKISDVVGKKENDFSRAKLHKIYKAMTKPYWSMAQVY